MPHSSPLSASQLRKVRALSRPDEREPSEASGELNVVPLLDVVVNVSMFVLATLPALFGATITSTPAREGSRESDEAGLQLKVLITSDGLSLKAAGGAVGPGCVPGPGITLPRRGGDLDWTGLTECAAALKRASPRAAHESTVQLAAEPAIDFQTLVRAADALRQTPGPTPEPLFPDVTFVVPR